MRILVLAPHQFYIDRGTPIDADNMVRALSDRGETVDVLAYPDGEARSYPRMTLHRIADRPWLRNTKPGFSLRKVACDVYMFFKAWGLLRRRQYDVVHAGEETVYLALVFKRLFGVPYVYDMDSSVAQQMVEQMPWLRPLGSIFNWLERQAIRESLATAPVCRILADLAANAGAPCHVTVYDISLLRDEDMRSDHRLREELGIDGMMAMYVGNLEPYQGVDLLLESFRVALDIGSPPIDLVIAGGTPRDIRKYETLAAQLDIEDHTHFIGPWPADRLGALLTEADILVGPRIRGVNTPMKIFPYLHSGRAVLATDLPTHTQILDDAVAMLASPTPTAFADALVRLAMDEPLRRRLGTAGRAFVRANHTYRAHRVRVGKLYDRVEAALETAAVARPAPQPSRVSAPVPEPSSVGAASTASTRSSRVRRTS